MRVLRVSLVIALAACGGGDDPTDPNGDDGVDNFTAKIDGVDWNAEFPPAAVNAQPGMYSITGLRATGSNNYTMVFSLWNIPGPGTYPLGVNLQMFGGIVLLSQPPSSGWSTTLDGNAGEIVITTLSATQIAGTFEFAADPQIGTTGMRTITEGAFAVPITAGGAGVAPANKGSSFSGMVGASPIYGAQATQILVSGTLTMIFQDDTRSITVGIANMTGSGVYALSSSGPIRSIQVGNVTGAAWSTNLTGGSGSVSLTVTPDRISGSFIATVVGAGGGATGPMDISGTFSLGRG